MHIISFGHCRRQSPRFFGSVRNASRASQNVSLPVAPNFTEYRASKLEYLDAEKGSVLRLDCMKPQSALSHLLVPMPLIRKPFPEPYDCSAIAITRKWCDISGQDRSSQVITKGVRDSIFLLLSSISPACDELMLPGDVYPVYEKLANKTLSPSTKYTQFSTLSGLNISSIGLESASKNAALLLPFPLTPLGDYPSPQDMVALQQWLRDGPDRRIILDCVYSYDMSADWQRLEPLRLSQVAFAFSLAKSWASPFLEPIALSPAAAAPVPRESFSRGIGFLDIADSSWRKQVHIMCEAYNMRPSQYAMSKADWLLSQQPRLPAVFAERFRAQWAKLSKAVQAVEPSFSPPVSGYFAAIPHSYVSLLQRDAPLCAVPASVFGSADALCSVVSCLFDIKSDDGAEGGGERWLRRSLPDSDCALPGPEDEADMYHVTTVSNFIKGYDKYTREYSKQTIVQSTFPDKFFLLLESQLQIGVDKASRLLDKLSLPGDALLVLHTKERPAACTPHPRGQFVDRNWIKIAGLSILKPSSEGFEAISVEEASALSLKVNKTELMPYDRLRPRSISILPIAKGCQARCPFCFSKGSVSDDMAQKLLPREVVEAVIQKAKASGAERAVITGGGEPMMMPFVRLLSLISQCAVFDTVCMITNGYFLSQLSEGEREDALRQLDVVGLTVLSVSRHAASDAENEKIMYLNTESACVGATWARMQAESQFSRLTRMRWVCVLQKGGVDRAEKLKEYLNFAADTGVPEICFKELYVSTSTESLYHDAASNEWSEANQVPLSLVLDFCKSNGFRQIATLPWGAPVYEGSWNGQPLKIAAYTEPSVYWERSNGLCRSWNLMADKTVMASLEDKESAISY